MYCNTSTLTISIRVLNKMRREKSRIYIYIYTFQENMLSFLITVTIFVILLMDCVIIDNIKLLALNKVLKIIYIFFLKMSAIQ